MIQDQEGSIVYQNIFTYVPQVYKNRGMLGAKVTVSLKHWLVLQSFLLEIDFLQCTGIFLMETNRIFIVIVILLSTRNVGFD